MISSATDAVHHGVRFAPQKTACHSKLTDQHSAAPTRTKPPPPGRARPNNADHYARAPAGARAQQRATETSSGALAISSLSPSAGISPCQPDARCREGAFLI